MADEIDKFVLTYAVDSKRAAQMLEDLNKLVEKTGKSSDDSSHKFRSFLSGISPEFGRLNSFITASTKGLESFGKVGLGVGASLGGIGLAMAAIGISTRMALGQMNE